MKRVPFLYTAIAVLLPSVGCAIAQDRPHPITSWRAWGTDASPIVRVATNASSYSKDLEVAERSLVGNFSLQLGIANSTGTVTLTYEISNDGVWYSTPVGYAVLGTALGTGTNTYITVMPVCKRVRWRVVTTNDGADITGVVLYQ